MREGEPVIAARYWLIALVLQTTLILCGLHAPSAYASTAESANKCLPEKSTLNSIRSVESLRGVTHAEQTEIFFPPQNQPAKGVAIVLHGLNNKASSTNEIASSLAANGIVVVRGGLTGHGGDLNQFATVTRLQWLTDAHRAWCLAKSIAAPLKLPVSAVGFSLGALVLADLGSSPEFFDVKFSRAVFLAPAISVRIFTYAIKLLSPFPAITIPSANIMELRANPSGTPVSAYKALFASISAIENRGFNSITFPALLFVHPKDELVSRSGLLAIIRKRPTSDWVLEDISIGSDSKLAASKHAIFESRLIGMQSWELVIQKSVSFLINNN